nr:SMI1/KNR4 family protein [Pseudomonas syringae]
MAMIYTEKNSPAEAGALDCVCKQLGISEKSWLRDFWHECNGAMIEDQIVIYSMEGISERNNTYEISTSFPEYVLIGDDSGGRLILIRKDGSSEFYLLGSGDPFIDDAAVFDSVEALASFVSCDGYADS